ncbi:MAG: hypothetical protein WA667_24515 [Candidatus Nitrosopolaris sp.]
MTNTDEFRRMNPENRNNIASQYLQYVMGVKSEDDIKNKWNDSFENERSEGDSILNEFNEQNRRDEIIIEAVKAALESVSNPSFIYASAENSGDYICRGRNGLAFRTNIIIEVIQHVRNVSGKPSHRLTKA